MNGWFKLNSDFFINPIWLNSTPEQCKILLTLLHMANHDINRGVYNGEQYEVQPGQIITSLEVITIKSGKGISVQNVRTALKRFEKLGFLTSQSTNKNRLITIVNWGTYHNIENDFLARGGY